MPTDDEVAVLAANDAFYAAFEAEDARAMEHLWAEDVPCACIHPGWEPMIGRANVIDAWHRIFEGGGAPSIKVDSARALVYGEVALVLCVERITQRGGPGAGLLAATNVYVRQDGEWRMTHHQAGPVSQEETSPSIPPSKLN